ncbi:hypothetical protein Tco_0111434 [Tanacetum coccineum]
MADHSQKWHDGSPSKSVCSSSNSKGIVAIVSKIDSRGQDMKKLKENVHVIQVGCQLCGGADLDKECPLNEEVKSIEEVKYGEFGCSSHFNNEAKYHVGPPRYYTRVDNRPPFREKRPSLEELMNKHLEELRRRRDEMEEWVENGELEKLDKIRMGMETCIDVPYRLMLPGASLMLGQALPVDTQIEQLTKEFHTKAASEVPNSSVGQCKAGYANGEEPIDNTSSNETNELHEVSFISNADEHVDREEDDVPSRVLPC